MPRSKSKKKGSEAPGTPEWMMTFSDIVTLLLTFFILLMTFSTVEKEGFQRAAGALRGALGAATRPGERSRAALQKRDTDRRQVKDDSAETPARQAPESVSETLQELQAPEREILELSREDRHWRIKVNGLLMFRTGSPDLEYRYLRHYRKLAKTLREYPNHIVVEGHADLSETEIGLTDYPSGWELSATRALRIAEMMINAGFPREQIHVRAFGTSRPHRDGRSAAERSRNRRVDVLVLASEEER